MALDACTGARLDGLRCVCGFGPRFDLGPFTAAWYRAHREHHLRTFPDLDPASRRVLDDLIAWARR